MDLLASMGLLTESEGARVVELEAMPPCLILKNDGAPCTPPVTLRPPCTGKRSTTRSGACTWSTWAQSLHFRQVYAALGKMGFPWAGRLMHVGFGIMRVGGARSPGIEGSDVIARAIGVGAVIFNDLKQNRTKDIDYNPEEAISFEGETGPYVHVYIAVPAVKPYNTL